MINRLKEVIMMIKDEFDNGDYIFACVVCIFLVLGIICFLGMVMFMPFLLLFFHFLEDDRFNKYMSHFTFFLGVLLSFVIPNVLWLIWLSNNYCSVFSLCSG